MCEKCNLTKKVRQLAITTWHLKKFDSCIEQKIRVVDEHPIKCLVEEKSLLKDYSWKLDFFKKVIFWKEIFRILQLGSRKSRSPPKSDFGVSPMKCLLEENSLLRNPDDFSLVLQVEAVFFYTKSHFGKNSFDFFSKNSTNTMSTD
jgi:hypothetical protein